jgi:hypothetical protein
MVTTVKRTRRKDHFFILFHFYPVLLSRCKPCSVGVLLDGLIFIVISHLTKWVLNERPLQGHDTIFRLIYFLSTSNFYSPFRLGLGGITISEEERTWQVTKRPIRKIMIRDSGRRMRGPLFLCYVFTSTHPLMSLTVNSNFSVLKKMRTRKIQV